LTLSRAANNEHNGTGSFEDLGLDDGELLTAIQLATYILLFSNDSLDVTDFELISSAEAVSTSKPVTTGGRFQRPAAIVF